MKITRAASNIVKTPKLLYFGASNHKQAAIPHNRAESSLLNRPRAPLTMLRILAFATLAAASKVSVLPQSKLLTLRGGMDLGPLDADNVGGFLKVAAAVTAASAVTEKYAGLGETTLTKLFKGDVWTTNLIIAMVTGVTSNVLYSVGASGFDSSKLSALLWLASLAIKLKDSPDVATITGTPVESAVAIVSGLLAFA